ncbi:MAG: sigma-70 family RNA polymerase sigma factor [Williamsia sp.]|nr:sigma-70 family RNA polymerase sigma factor [Williamsia sp.]
MTKPCYQILNNEELIQILQDGTQKSELEVYTCLKQIFRETMIRRLIKPGQGLPGADTQRLIAEEVFHEAFVALVNNVREGGFEAKAREGKTAGSVGYFFGILWHLFQHALKRKYNRNFYSFNEQAYARRVEMSPDLPAYNREDGTSVMLQTAVRMLPEKCRRYMQWYYIEKKDTDEIISLVTDAPGTVKRDLSRCRGKLQEKVRALCNFGL